MEQKIRIPNRDKENIAGILVNPGSETLAIICHGFLLHKDAIFFPELAEALAQKGIASFRFDFAGNNESEGEFGQDSIPKEVGDLNSIINFFSSKFKRIGLIGHSKGGAVCILVASENKKVNFLVSIAAVAYPFKHFLTKLTAEERRIFKEVGEVSLLRALGKNVPLTKEMIKDLHSLDIPQAASEINVPSLVIHAEDDLLVDKEEAEAIASRIKSVKVKMFKKGGHFFMKERAEMIDAITRWFECLNE